jgi:hypothetical protein
MLPLASTCRETNTIGTESGAPAAGGAGEGVGGVVEPGGGCGLGPGPGEALGPVLGLAATTVSPPPEHAAASKASETARTGSATRDFDFDTGRFFTPTGGWRRQGNARGCRSQSSEGLKAALTRPTGAPLKAGVAVRARPPGGAIAR